MVFMKPCFILKKKKTPEVQRPSVASSPLLIQTRLLRNWPIWKLKDTLEYLQHNSDPRHIIWKYKGQIFYVGFYCIVPSIFSVFLSETQKWTSTIDLEIALKTSHSSTARCAI